MLLNCGAGEDSWESPLDSKIKSLNLKGNQPFIFTGRTDAEVEAPILLATCSKSWLIRKDPDVGKDWRQEEKGTMEDEMVGWSPTQRTWVWANSRRWWRTRKPGMLRSMGLRRVEGLNNNQYLAKNAENKHPWIYIFRQEMKQGIAEHY